MDIQNLKSENSRGQPMQLSIHYYVLLLSEHMSRLYEEFRDHLVDMQNTNVPFESSIDAGSPVKPACKDTPLRECFHRTDQCFVHYYEQEPLRLVVVGEKEYLAICEALTTHRNALIGMVEGDHTASSPHKLGEIVGPAVKQAIAGANENAMRDLAIAAKAKKVVCGIGATQLV